MIRKGTNKPFASLPDKRPDSIALQCLKERVELSERSLIGTHVISRFADTMSKHEQGNGVKRIEPGYMLEEYNGASVLLPMLPPDAVDRLAQKSSLPEFFAHRELEQHSALQNVNPDATPNDLWSLTAKPVSGRVLHEPTPRDPEDAVGRTERLSALAMATPASVGAVSSTRSLKDSREVPKEVVQTLQQEFADGFTMRHSLIAAMCGVLGSIYDWLHPNINELKPGQVLWLGRAIECPRDWTGKVRGLKYLPVTLTHHTQDERPHAFTTPSDFFAMEQIRVARMTTEAYVQGAVLSTQDLALLLVRPTSHVAKILDAYQRKHNVLLPTTGTVLDMGSTLTHKRFAVELSLQGHNTSQIAKSLFHTEKAIDNYLTAFNKVAMLYVLISSEPIVISQVTSLSVSLVKEYLALITRYLPDRSEILQHLKKAGIELPSALIG